MEKIFRFYNQNRKSILLSVLTIVLVIVLVQALNNLVKENTKREKQEQKKNANIIKQEEYKENPDISITISDTQVYEKKNMIIDQFIRYCNAGEIESAYNLLSDDCKNELYPNIGVFKKNYIDIVFESTKLYSKEQYCENTYKVRLYEDIISTGKASNSIIEDYYTVQIEESKIKVNISGYIGKENIDKNYNSNNLNINIVSKKIFKEYEEYKIEVTNSTSKEIVLDDMKDTKSTYLIGKENVKYYALIHEKTREDLIIPANVKKTITLKFNKSYTSNNVKERGITFSNIVLNMDKKKIEITF